MADAEESGNSERQGCLTRPMTWGEWLIAAGMLVLLWSLLFHPFYLAREEGRDVECTNNQKQIVIAILVWEQDHEGKLPSSRTIWADIGMSGASTPAIRCPRASALPNGYVYNSRIAGKTEKEIGNDPTLAFLTADGQHVASDEKPPNVAFTMADLDVGRHNLRVGIWPIWFKGAPRFIASFLDEHAAVMTPEDAKGWLPE